MGADSGVTVRDSAGITIVENRQPDTQLRKSPVLIADLVPPDSALMAAPWGIAADPFEQHVHVVDRHGSRVVTFDESGVFVRSFGREGDGPGEFRTPSAATLDEHGALVIWDTSRRILSRWSSRGDLLNEQRAPFEYWGPGFALPPNGMVTVAAARSSGGMKLEQRLVARTGMDTRAIHAVLMDIEMLVLPCVSMPAPKLFAPSVVWANHGDTTYYLNGHAYRIDVYVEGSTVASVRRLFGSIAVTDELAITAVRSGSSPYTRFMRRCPATAQQIAEAVGHEEVVSPVLALAVDPEGRMWVTRSSDGISPAFIDILSAAGEYQGTFSAVGVPVAFLSSSVFVNVRLTDSAETVVSLYRLEDSHATGGESQVTTTSSNTTEFRDCAECPLMVELPPGRYLMGAPDGEAPAALDPDRPAWSELAERPQIQVDIEYSFAIGKYEVTFSEYDQCLEAGGCTHQPNDEGFGRGDRPVMNVSRADAEQYIAWLNSRSGEAYRLPSEAEWEYAARAGTTSPRHWGDELGTAQTVCDGCGSVWDDRSTAPVGSFRPNEFRLHDMLGNVAEWVADCWHDTHEGAPGDGSARIESSPWWRAGACERPVKRGGAWSYFPWTVRAAKRTYFHPGPWSDRSPGTGFRVARTMAGAS